MQSCDVRIGIAAGNGGRIKPPGIRVLYNSFCGQLIHFSPHVEVEVARFETRFTSPEGMLVILTPYRDIFMVSVGTGSPCDIRVAGEEGYFRALDLALNHFLSMHSCPGE